MNTRGLPDAIKSGQSQTRHLKEFTHCSIFIALEQDASSGLPSAPDSGPVNYQHLVAFIAYVKTCLVWMEAHPEVAYEADKRVQNHLGALGRACLADFFRNYRERVRSERQNRGGTAG